MALESARQIFSNLGMPGEINRADWGLALILLENANALRALELLNRIRHDYLARHMPEEAGEVGLCMVDALIATDQLEEARALTSRILSEFLEAKLNVSAIKALGYLQDLLQTTSNPHRAIRHIRSYVEKLKTEPARLFLPLDEKP